MVNFLTQDFLPIILGLTVFGTQTYTPMYFSGTFLSIIFVDKNYANSCFNFFYKNSAITLDSDTLISLLYLI